LFFLKGGPKGNKKKETLKGGVFFTHPKGGFTEKKISAETDPKKRKNSPAGKGRPPKKPKDLGKSWGG